MLIHKDSHLDHALSAAHLSLLLSKFGDRDAFFIETIDLPDELDSVTCGLFGPLMGDEAIGDTEVELKPRGTRAWPSRLIGRTPRMVRTLTVIAGPHDESCPACRGNGVTTSEWPLDTKCMTCDASGVLRYQCIIYTAFGGPLTPQEPGDPGCKNVDAAREFWSQHALAGA